LKSLFNKSKLNRIVESAIHWALVNGFVVVPKGRAETDLMVATYLPFTLCPTPLKQTYFRQVFDLQPNINQLVYKIANSPDIMERAFENLLVIDPFICKLWATYKEALRTGANQSIQFSILRCDYMLHQNLSNKSEYAMKQVEINTIAAGFGWVGTRMSQLHREILKWIGCTGMIEKLPFNEPIVSLAKGFAETWRLYNSKKAIVLFIILDIENNIADQRHLEYEIIKQEPQIEVKRCTLSELYQHSYLDETKSLIYDHQEVAIVYYRAGYAPDHFKSHIEWDALLRIEMSKSVKCPTIGTFLSGMKKIQEFISYEKNLNNLLENDAEKINAVKSVFAEFFKLDNEKNMDRVLTNPENYVLKPQREGGGNNYYKAEIREILSKIRELEKDSNSVENQNSDHKFKRELYVVMELLRPAISKNFLISPKLQMIAKQSGKECLTKINITNELGIYGVLVKNGPVTVLNESSGYCLRSKPAEDDEAGVMCGSGALDSVYFID
jgi:glutathione synthase